MRPTVQRKWTMDVLARGPLGENFANACSLGGLTGKFFVSHSSVAQR